MKYLFEISYLGTNYHGWQIQNNAVSVQEVINNALHKLLKEEIVTTGSGRTDTGVHALQQFFHLETERLSDVEDFIFHMNAILPQDIVVHSVKEIKKDAHARFDAISRSYIYKIIKKKDPFSIDQAYKYTGQIDVEEMQKAANMLVGKHDFQSFSRVKTSVNNFICEVFEARWEYKNDKLDFHIKANRFLRGMVRAIVGTLLLVGEGKIKSEKIIDILNTKDRKAAGRAVPACGLYLVDIEYPKNIFE